MRSHSLCAFSRQLRPFCRTAFPASRRNLLPAVRSGSFSRQILPPLRFGGASRPASRSVFRPGQCPTLPAFRIGQQPRPVSGGLSPQLLPADSPGNSVLFRTGICKKTAASESRHTQARSRPRQKTAGSAAKDRRPGNGRFRSSETAGSAAKDQALPQQSQTRPENRSSTAGGTR